MPTTCVRLENLTKHFGANTAVMSLDLEIKEGEILGLLGPNGAGKSTTLSMIAGLVRPSAGSISVFGKDLAQHRLAASKRMGILMEDPAFYPHLSVAKNLYLLARLEDREITLDRTLDLVGLLPHADQRVSTLSRGMRQRLGLAQAFLTEPEILILDEPTTALDTDQTAEIVELLRRFSRQANVTIILSSHQMDEVETLCDRVAVLDRGRLAACEKTDAILTYDRTQVDVLLDSPEAAAKKLSQEPWIADVEIARGRLRVRLLDATPNHLATYLHGAGFSIHGLIPRRRSLQELFLKAKNQ